MLSPNDNDINVTMMQKSRNKEQEQETLALEVVKRLNEAERFLRPDGNICSADFHASAGQKTPRGNGRAGGVEQTKTADRIFPGRRFGPIQREFIAAETSLGNWGMLHEDRWPEARLIRTRRYKYVAY